jgi:hypothetical protein
MPSDQSGTLGRQAIFDPINRSAASWLRLGLIGSPTDLASELAEQNYFKVWRDCLLALKALSFG